jgi:flavin reductase (DIM6/NTAB) family NADH-FMN oxidoreductase RutF
MSAPEEIPAQPAAASTPGFDPRAFRDALGQFATGVAVVTARGADGVAVGVTMSSFNSVSLAPPLVLFSVDRRAYSLGALLGAKGYGINILGRHQEALSNRFAKALADKWHDVAHAAGYAEAPLIAGALAHFECRPYAHHDGGDHVIFIAEVLSFATPSPEEEPLVFFRGRYRSLASDDQRAAPPEWPLPIHYF